MNDKLNQFLGIWGSKGAVFTGGIWRKDGGWEGAEASWGPIAGSWPPRGQSSRLGLNSLEIQKFNPLGKLDY